MGFSNFFKVIHQKKNPFHLNSYNLDSELSSFVLNLSFPNLSSPIKKEKAFTLINNQMKKDSKKSEIAFNTEEFGLVPAIESAKAATFINESDIEDKVSTSITNTVLEIEDEEIVELFVQALVAQQNTKSKNKKDILEHTIDILSQALVALAIEKENADFVTEQNSVVAKIVSSVREKENKDIALSESSILIPPKVPNAPLFTANTAKKIMSIADIIRESLSKGSKLQPVSGSSKISQAEEVTFDLGAMGKVTGKEVSILAARMAKLKAVAEKNSLPEAYGMKTEKINTASTATDKDKATILTWNRTRPTTSKFTLKKTASAGKAMSLVDLAGEVKLKSTSKPQKNV